MALNLKLSATCRSAMMDAITSTIGSSGYLRIYSGTQPADCSAAITGTLLAELALSATAAAAASSGVLTFNAITQDSSANATNTATHFRIWKSDGTTAVCDGTVGTASCDLIINTTSIVSGGAVSVTSFVLTAPNA